MGIWKSLGETALSVGKKATKALQDTTKETRKLEAEYRSYSDDKLKSILASGGIAKKMAATRILKKRGYGSGNS